jgi:hypothetical protein
MEKNEMRVVFTSEAAPECKEGTNKDDVEKEVTRASCYERD